MPTIKLRRGLSTVWTANNPILKSGEAGVETDTHKLKLGDGTHAWNDLPYIVGGSAVPVVDNGDGTWTGGPVTGYTKAAIDTMLVNIQNRPLYPHA